MLRVCNSDLRVAEQPTVCTQPTMLGPAEFFSRFVHTPANAA